MPGEGDKIPFDKRIDEIGNAEDFVSEFVKDRRKGLKETLLAKGAERAEGDSHQAIIVESESRTVDAAALLKLLQKGKIRESDFFSAIKASAEKCEKFLSQNDLEKICTRVTTKSMKISQKKKAPIDLVACLKRLSSAIFG